MPAHHHFNLKVILRNANERYHTIAETFRENLHLSHYARKRAQAKGLKIDTSKASRCPQKLVSVLPLHEIDFTTTPTDDQTALEDMPVIPSIAHRRSGDVNRPVIPRIVIPALTSARRQPVVPSDGSFKVLAPVALRAQGGTWRGPTSWFPITPSDELFRVHSGKSVVPDAPLDIEDSTSSGSSDASSSGPSTPNDLSSLMIRFKRKSFETEAESVEKRPKYVRKEWAQAGPSYRRHGSEMGTSHA